MSGETCDLHAQPYEGTQSDALPSEDLLDVIASIKVLDKDKKEHLFSDLILHEDPKAQTFVFFIRHFFCPSCQTWMREVISGINPSLLNSTSPPTSFLIIGLGDPALITHWAAQTSCPYPIYTEPTGEIFRQLGCIHAYDSGGQGTYYSVPLYKAIFDGMAQVIRMPWMATKSGAPYQNGGDFLFGRKEEDGGLMVRWCHRMRHSTDHTRVGALKKVLGVEEPKEELQ